MTDATSPNAVPHTFLTPDASESEAQFGLLAEIAEFGVWELEIATNTLRWDERMHAIYGINPENFTGRYEDWAETLDMETRERSEDAFRALLEEDARFDIEMRIRRASDGELRHIRGLALVFRDADGSPVRVFGINEDITDRVIAQQRLESAQVALAREKERFQGIFEKTGSGVAVYQPVDGGRDFRFTEYNPASERIDSMRREDVIGKLLTENFPGVEEMGLLGALQTAARTGQTVDLPLVQYGDERISGWRENTIFRLSTGEVVAVYNDFTEIKQAQFEAEKANRARSEFLANMSHEIRTPMNAIIGLSELLAATPLDNKQRDYLGKITASSQMLLAIINDILDFSKIDAGKLQLECSPLDLRQVLRQLDALFSAAAAEKGIALNLALDTPDLPMFMGDELRLSQVLSNLLSNAVKFTERGSVQLRITEVRDAGDAVTLEFIVTDTGIGIDADRLAGLFKPFEQADASTTRTHGGTGLGLTISQELVKLMGSEIAVDSTPDQGSTFSFVITLTKMAQQASMSTSQAHSTGLPPDLSGKTILIAEDNALNRLVITELLARTGANLVLANNGTEAVELATREPVDLILMDLQMPDMDGFDAARAIRRTDATVPIFALSAAVMKDDRDAAIAAGMNLHLGKPIDREALFNALDEHLLGDVADGSPESDSVNGLPNALQGFDLIAGRAAFEGDDFYLQLLQMFLDQLGAEYAPLPLGDASEYTEDDWRLLHTLKGSAATVRATELFEVIVALEQTQGKHSEEAMAAFRETFNKTVATLRELNNS